jgi:hypothetical protein
MVIKGFDILGDQRIMYDLQFSAHIVNPELIQSGLVFCLLVSVYTMIIDGMNMIKRIENKHKEQ